MHANAKLLSMVKHVPVIPVLTVDGPQSAVPLARALVAGGLNVLEVTLRTDGALHAIEAMAKAIPDAIIGAGKVLTPSQIDDSLSAGAKFLVSPGATLKLAEAAIDRHAPLLPGVATASEAMALAEQGYHLLKFFPAEAAGGVSYLKSLAAPLPHRCAKSKILSRTSQCDLCWWIMGNAARGHQSG